MPTTTSVLNSRRKKQHTKKKLVLVRDKKGMVPTTLQWKDETLKAFEDSHTHFVKVIASVPWLDFLFFLFSLSIKFGLFIGKFCPISR